MDEMNLQNLKVNHNIKKQGQNISEIDIQIKELSTMIIAQDSENSKLKNTLTQLTHQKKLNEMQIKEMENLLE